MSFQTTSPLRQRLIKRLVNRTILGSLGWMMSSFGCAPGHISMTSPSRFHERPTYGVVEQQRSYLWGEQRILTQARHCRKTGSRQQDRAVLTPAEIASWNCRVRRYRGPLSVDGVDSQGTSIPHIYTANANEDGKVTIYYADIDAALVRKGFSGLDALVSLHLGHQAWAGSISLADLRILRADAYYRWVKQGRGTLGLFLARYPKHVMKDEVQAWTIQ